VALAGCGSSHTVTVKVETPAGSRTSTVTSAALERCRAENAAIERENQRIEAHNREQERLPPLERHLRVIEGRKLCIP